jgi:type IV secretory pathway VirB2 component (pilin)
LPWHGIIGWVVVALGWVQVLGGWLRGSKGGPQPTAQAPVETAIPGDHYEMTLRRQVFERLHKSLGYFALLLSVVAVMLGLRLADAPSWMGWAVAAIWVVGIGLFVRLQRASHCIDTYQAIWGPDLRHPGNRVEPIGIGISRGRGPGQPDHSGELTS